MNPLYHNQSSCVSLQLLEDEDHEYQTISSTTLNSTPQTSSTSSPSYLVHFHPSPQRENINEADQKYKQDDQDDDHIVFIPPPCDEIPKYETKINHSDSIQPLIRDGGNKQCNNGSPVRWMSSKIRLMKKMMMTSDQTVTSCTVTNNDQASHTRQRSPLHELDEPSNYSPTNKIRVCSDCNTTKTPLWRSGPQGPKSLCNACGIRQRKAKRAMAAAAASGGLLGGAYTSSNKVIKEKRSSSFKDQTTQYKKRFKLSAAPRSSKNSIEFDELRMSLSKSLAFHQVLIPQDEKEAAILLMALSCGLVHG